MGRTRTHNLREHWKGESVSIDFRVKTLLQVVTFLLMVKQFAVYGYLLSIGRIDLTMFTYWSYTVLTIFYPLLLLGLVLERAVLALVCLFLLPLPLGATFDVSVAIVIVIQQNAKVFTSEADAGRTAINLIHTGDWVLHNLPLIEVIFLMGTGLLFYVRSILPAELHELRNREWGFVYRAYFYAAPLVLIGIYSIAFDITRHYPTNIPTYVLWLGLACINLLWMGVWYLAFTADANVPIRLWTFFGGSGSGAARDDDTDEDSPAAAAASGATSELDIEANQRRRRTRPDAVADAGDHVEDGSKAKRYGGHAASLNNFSRGHRGTRAIHVARPQAK